MQFLTIWTDITSVSTRAFIILWNDSGDTPILGSNAEVSGVWLSMVATISAVMLAGSSSERESCTKFVTHNTIEVSKREKKLRNKKNIK